MKKITLIIILIIFANFSNIYAEDQKKIDYRRGESIIDKSVVKTEIFPKAQNLKVISNKQGIFAYLNIKGQLNAKKKIVEWINDDYIKKITIAQFNRREIRIVFMLKQKANYFYCYSEFYKQIKIIREVKNSDLDSSQKIIRVLNKEKKKKLVKEILKDLKQTKTMTPLKRDKRKIKSLAWKKTDAEFKMEFKQNATFKLKVIKTGNERLLAYDIPLCVNPQVSNTFKNLENKEIRKIRVQQYDPKTVRIVFYLLKAGVSPKIQQVNNCLSFQFCKKVISLPAARVKKRLIERKTIVTSAAPQAKAKQVTIADTRSKEEDDSNNLSAGDSDDYLASLIADDAENASETEADQNDFNFSGKINFRAKKDIHRDNPYESTHDADGEVLLKAEYNPRDSNFKATAAIKASFNTDLPGDKVEYDIDKTYVEYKTGSSEIPISLLIGKNTLRYGKTDDISPVNNLNAEDYRLFLTKDYMDRLIPAWMFNAKTSINDWGLEITYLPFFQKAKVDVFGSDWSTFSYFKEEIRDTNKMVYNTIVKDLDVIEYLPEDKLSNGEFGLRVSRKIGNFNTEWIYSYSFEDLPYYRQVPGIIKGQPSYTTENFILDYRNRYHLLGAAFEAVYGDIGLKGEIAWMSDKSFMKEDFNSYRGSVLHYVLGIEYTHSDFYANLQFSHQINLDYEANTLFTKANDLMIFGKVSYGNIIGNRLSGKSYEIGTNYGFNLNSDGLYFKPFAKYYFKNGLTAEVNTNIFLGSENTLFGNKADGTEFIFEVSYEF